MLYFLHALFFMGIFIGSLLIVVISVFLFCSLSLSPLLFCFIFSEGAVSSLLGVNFFFFSFLCPLNNLHRTAVIYISI